MAIRTMLPQSQGSRLFHKASPDIDPLLGLQIIILRFEMDPAGGGVIPLP
jgi:hypothetical protein